MNKTLKEIVQEYALSLNQWTLTEKIAKQCGAKLRKTTAYLLQLKRKGLLEHKRVQFCFNGFHTTRSYWKVKK